MQPHRRRHRPVGLAQGLRGPVACCALLRQINVSTSSTRYFNRGDRYRCGRATKRSWLQYTAAAARERRCKVREIERADNENLKDFRISQKRLPDNSARRRMPFHNLGNCTTSALPSTSKSSHPRRAGRDADAGPMVSVSIATESVCSGEIRQVARMQAYGHGVWNRVESIKDHNYRPKFERGERQRTQSGARKWRQSGGLAAPL